MKTMRPLANSGLAITGLVAVAILAAEIRAQSLPFGPVIAVSLGTNGQPIPGGAGTDAVSLAASVSEDGTKILFATDVPLHPLDLNPDPDLYLHDGNIGQTFLVTKDTSGNALGTIVQPVLSADGTSALGVGFLSNGVAPEWGIFHFNLANPSSPIIRRITFRYDLMPIIDANLVDATPDLLFITVGSVDFLTPPSPGESPSAFVEKVYRINTSDLTVVRVSPACSNLQFNNFSRGSAISDDGRFVAFASRCDSLVPNDNNGGQDVFIHDCFANTIQLVSSLSVSPNSPATYGREPILLSGDGNCVAFMGDRQTYLGPQAPSGSGMIWRNRITGETRSLEPSSLSALLLGCRKLSYDGSKAMVCGGSSNLNEFETVIMEPRTGESRRVSRNSDGTMMSLGNTLTFYPYDWTENERWIVGGLQLVLPNNSVFPPIAGEAEIVRIDLGPGLNLGGSVSGLQGTPDLRLLEGFSPVGSLLVVFEHFTPNAQVLLGLGTSAAPTPLVGGTLWPNPLDSVTFVNTDSLGNLILTASIPPGLPSGYQVVGQLASPDPTAAFGAVLSNGLLYRIP